MTPKLTPTQLSVIKRMKEGERLRRNNFSGNWYLGSDTVNYRTCYRLNELGLIEVKGEMNHELYTLTQKGREIEI